MSLDERKRTELARYLEGDLKPQAVELMIEAMSGPEWRELATKQDLHALATREDLQVFATKQELQALDHKVDLVEQRLKAEIHKVGRNQLLGFASIVAIFNTAAFSAIALVRL
jgi:hypothetical protein